MTSPESLEKLNNAYDQLYEQLQTVAKPDMEYEIAELKKRSNRPGWQEKVLPMSGSLSQQSFDNMLDASNKSTIELARSEFECGALYRAVIVRNGFIQGWEERTTAHYVSMQGQNEKDLYYSLRKDASAAYLFPYQGIAGVSKEKNWRPCSDKLANKLTENLKTAGSILLSGAVIVRKA